VSAPSKLTVESSGVYRTPADVSELRDQAAGSGAQWLEADLAGARDKAALMRALAGALAVPAGFGANWDALADSLQDLGWRSGVGYVLHLRHAARARQALGPEWDRLIEVLRASADAWRLRGKPFLAILDGAAELPRWP
jgi:hypothetical protein